MPDNTAEPFSKGAISEKALQAGVRQSLGADHLYVDGDNLIRDSHIEHMFEDLFFGKPLDTIFQNNFGQYFSFLTEGDPPPIEIYDNVTLMRAWVSENFGTLLITPPLPGTMDDDPDLAHCKFRAIFREPARFNIDACYAPTELHAGLLCVVTVYRQLAQKFNDDRFTAKPSSLN